MEDSKLEGLKREELVEMLISLREEKDKQRFTYVLRSTIATLIVVAACAVLIATFFMPVLQIHGTSMTPTLQEGSIVLSVKGTDFKPGDLIAFYIGNKLLVKRCIAGSGVTIFSYG